jgi:predicted nucleotidyltransferase component of viral defense system
MSSPQPKNITASVHQRLLNLAHQEQEDFLDVLRSYALERLLYRVSRMEDGSHLILKGALAFRLWQEKLHRATRDLDFLGSGDNSAARYQAFFDALCALDVEEDGLRFLAESVVVRQVREDEEYPGVRIQLLARLGPARIPLVVDIGFGDVVTPAPAEVEFPTLLNFPKPRIRAYHRETVVAEKFWIMTQRALSNTRLKDYYDLWTLAKKYPFDGPLLCQAMQATFARRNTALPTETPIALTADFSENLLKQSQWSSFLKKGRLVKESVSLADVVLILHDFLMPPAQTLAAGQPFAQSWPAGGPWQAQSNLASAAS